MKKTVFFLFALLATARVAAATCSSTANMGLGNCALGTARSVVDPAWVANFLKLDFNFHTPLARSGVDVTLGTVPEAKGGTNQTTYAVGDTLKVATANTLSKLSGNTSATRKYRQQHGNGTAVTSDDWEVIPEGDLPALRLTALTQLDPALCAAGEFLLEIGGSSWGCGMSLLTSLSQIDDGLCTAGKALRRKASGSGWECYTPTVGALPPSLVTGSTGTGTVGGASFDWWHLQGISTVTTTEADVSNPMPAGTFKKIGCEILTAQSTDSDGYTIGLAKVGTGITLQGTVYGSGHLSFVTTSDFAVSDGDEFSWIAIGNGSYTATVAKCWALFLPS